MVANTHEAQQREFAWFTVQYTYIELAYFQFVSLDCNQVECLASGDKQLVNIILAVNVIVLHVIFWYAFAENQFERKTL